MTAEIARLRAAMAQPSPAMELELERPEVVAYLNEWRNRDQGGIRVTPALSAMSEEGLQKECGQQASVVRREPLMTVSQYDRIGMQWASLVHRAQAEADAPQARAAELEKQEPVGYVWPDELAAEAKGTPTGFVAFRILACCRSKPPQSPQSPRLGRCRRSCPRRSTSA